MDGVLARLYREVRGSSPPKGMLPFSVDWFMTWLPNIHASLFHSIYRYMDEHTPARKARAAANSYSAQTQFLNRMLWKYEGWLNGFNGGPVRQPTMRINESTMNNLRQALVKSGITPTDSPNSDFFVGRHPVATAG